MRAPQVASYPQHAFTPSAVRVGAGSEVGTEFDRAENVEATEHTTVADKSVT